MRAPILRREQGEFERVTALHELVYSWRVEPGFETMNERVTVRFDPCEAGTEVVIRHERIGEKATRDAHESGWTGCLDGLTAFLSTAGPG
jgi:uncharacterized protein YndB with AHSA1/START domain